MRAWRYILPLLVLSLSSCGARKNITPASPAAEVQKTGFANIPDFAEIEKEIETEENETSFQLIDHALQFLGTKYKYGGTTPEGMDCSGLVYTTFLQRNIELPRSSRDMALLGQELGLDQIRTGDLLFFITDRRKKNINHVGLVVELDQEHIFFIHSSTSRGVIISRLDENYWRDHFVMARRIL
ncbi:C40 family peptidase [Salinimicrobium oceani]|uniref:C40 family peptidase n=1 Tax=Salinimicrobium oceani TaxID=2722702 RepID=A0ABX1CXY9_9FLAO|nr:C40 family peptidase [Salinimicrobium oceani]NJW53136.1 C40 family peptidase [Salinimicrobium oceani]